MLATDLAAHIHVVERAGEVVDNPNALLLPAEKGGLGGELEHSEVRLEVLGVLDLRKRELPGLGRALLLDGHLVSGLGCSGGGGCNLLLVLAPLSVFIVKHLGGELLLVLVVHLGDGRDLLLVLGDVLLLVGVVDLGLLSPSGLLCLATLLLSDTGGLATGNLFLVHGDDGLGAGDGSEFLPCALLLSCNDIVLVDRRLARSLLLLKECLLFGGHLFLGGGVLGDAGILALLLGFHGKEGGLFLETGGFLLLVLLKGLLLVHLLLLVCRSDVEPGLRDSVHKFFLGNRVSLGVGDEVLGAVLGDLFLDGLDLLVGHGHALVDGRE
eukprot:PhM_4_TR18100/c2_g1_i1/m.57097